MANNPQFKINQIAKDLGKKSKDIVEVLVGKGIDVKNSQKTLEAEEFDILFDTLTKENQITEIENYIDGITYIPAKEKPAEKVPEKAPEAVVEKAEEKPALKAPEVKQEEKPVKKAEAPVQPVKKEEAKKLAETPKAPKAPEAPKAPKAPETQKPQESKPGDFKVTPRQGDRKSVG